MLIYVAFLQDVLPFICDVLRCLEVLARVLQGRHAERVLGRHHGGGQGRGDAVLF